MTENVSAKTEPSAKTIRERLRAEQKRLGMLPRVGELPPEPAPKVDPQPVDPEAETQQFSASYFLKFLRRQRRDSQK